MRPMIEVEVFEPLYSEEKPSEINLKNLSELLGINNLELAKALHIDATSLSKNPYTRSNPVLNNWMATFNLIISIIAETQPDLSPEGIRIKMQKWIKMPRPEFSGVSALNMMLAGKVRKVNNLLEQIKA